MSTALQLPPRKEFLPVATSFVEQSVNAYGGDSKLQYALMLATEEVFVRFCELPLAADDIRIETRDRRYFVEVRFTFRSSGLDLRAFNLTAQPLPANDGSLQDLGLYLAARLVDSLKLAIEPEGSLELTLIKDRQYPEGAGLPGDLLAPQGDFSIASPGIEETKLLAAMIHGRFDAALAPPFVGYPGKTADMVASGDLRAAVARCGNGALAGGVFWRMSGARTLEMIGPYVFFTEEKDAATHALIEHCIREAARTSAMGIFCRQTPEPLSPRHFDLLGETQAGRFYYRHLVEDDGSPVFCDPALAAYLRAEYARQVLPRELRMVQHMGERMEEHSVLTCEFALPASQVTLRGLCAGKDAVENVAAHLAHLQGKGVRNISFEMDLGRAWEVAFTPALMSAGFTPAIIIPNAASADLLIWWKAA